VVLGPAVAAARAVSAPNRSDRLDDDNRPLRALEPRVRADRCAEGLGAEELYHRSSIQQAADARGQGPDLSETPGEESLARRSLDWRGLDPVERRLWFEQLWRDVLALRERYRLPLRAGWWTDPIQLEALAALAAWVERYDSGEWDDPPGKLALLYDLERVGVLLRDGRDPFNPERDRSAFLSHLERLADRATGA